jgi:non-specific serine/threonine protein kinase
MSVLGRLALLQGNLGQATRLQQESLVLRRHQKDRLGITRCLEGLAWVANAQGRPLQAARLFGAAEAVRGRIGAAPWPAWHAEHERNVAATRASLGEAAFAAAWAAGRALSMDEAIEEALGEGEPAPMLAPSAEPASAARAADPLSPREREVAALIAQGLTNRQIAEALVISEWTADTHVRHILTKLEFRSRAQVAAWATERGLLEQAPL